MRAVYRLAAERSNKATPGFVEVASMDVFEHLPSHADQVGHLLAGHTLARLGNITVEGTEMAALHGAIVLHSLLYCDLGVQPITLSHHPRPPPLL